MIEDQEIEITLAAFLRQPRMCIHQIMEATNLPRAQLRHVLADMVRREQIKRVPAKVSGDQVYELTALSRLAHSAAAQTVLIQVKNPESIKLLGGDETTARNRIIMLRKMRARLISDWHPVLDKVIGDYEAGLQVLDELANPRDVEEGEFNHIWDGKNGTAVETTV